MPSWLVLVISLCAFFVGIFALLRANRVDATMRRALANLPADFVADPDIPGRQVTLPDVQGPLCHQAIVRFDAFADISGKLSSSAALLDEHGNGLVITTMNGRDTSRCYLKEVRRGVGASTLSPEETDAVARAMGVRNKVS
jgi:Protein of unknown function (DUF4446)